jgi:cyclopropane fatty-acyl-phospholipid synthase-like methyltransferase
MSLLKDVQGQAMLDYYAGKEEIKLLIHTSYGEPEDMPVEVFFRELEDFTKLEKLALKNCKGEILDIGAAAGSFSMELEEKGKMVTALEISEACCQIMRERGITNVLEKDIWTYQEKKYDTLLLIMNGLGLAGTLSKLPSFLNQLKDLLLPGGQIICDSSDISYLYKDIAKPDNHYYGEIKYKYEYEGKQGEWFEWLYVDTDTLTTTCTELGMNVEVLCKNKYDQTLYKISIEQ